MKRYRLFFIVGAAGLTVPAGPLLSQTMQPNRLTIPGEQAASAKRPAESVHIRGDSRASVTLEEFGDFECPMCKNFAALLDEVIKEYHPRVRLIFRNYPLAMHHYSRDAARAAEAAGLQGRYWEMHDMLYREQPVWNSSNNARILFISYAETLGLDLDRFQKDMQSDKVRERIEYDEARARSLGVKTTPSLFVDKHEMEPNDLGEDGVRRLIDEAMKAKTASAR
jgi:protein-disulfide isomerase